MALVGEADLESYVAQGLIAIEHQVLRPFDPLFQQPLMRRAADRLPEGLTEMAG